MLMMNSGGIVSARLPAAALTPGNTKSPSVTISAGYFLSSPGW